MSEHVFDLFARHASAETSRRNYVRVFAGLVLGGIWSAALPLEEMVAKNGRKNRKRNRKRDRRNKKNQATNSPRSCASSCAGKVCGDDGCGGSCGTCGASQLCAQGRCVTGQGTCDAGDDICIDFGHSCGATGGCHCRTSMSNQTRCGQDHEIDDRECTSEADCANFFPETPGAFCAQAVGANCPNPVGLCFAPCAA